MGLDMFLTKRLYIGEQYGHRLVVINKGKEIPIEEVIQEVIIPVGYWRKANAIHNWFVRNVQEGIDDCKEYYVTRKDLEKLRAQCNEVLVYHTIENGLLGGSVKGLAKKILPPEGFFFSDTEYDDSYIEDLKTTVGILNKALDQAVKDEARGLSFNFYYQSSW